MLSISALVSSRRSLLSPHHTADGRTRRRSRVSPSASSRPRSLSRLAVSTAAITLLSINGVSASPSLPYIPTTILVPSEWPLDDTSSAPIKKGSINDNRAYIITPRASGAGVDLLTLDFSNTLSTSSESSTPQVVPIPSSPGNSIPPFLTGDATHTTFTPTILPNGTLAIITGDSSCSSSTNSAKIYTYSSTVASSASSPHASGVWTSRSVTPSVQSSWDTSESLNPYFYAAGISFSSQLAPAVSEPVFYLYGGMCPYPVTDNSSSGGNWRSAATYSNKMLRVSPDSSAIYTLDEASSAGGPPVAEAGYTFTPLTPPSLATRSGGVITQQMSYVMLGGHTQSAFVNMSTAAVWSLPEESWTFVAIKDSDGSSGGKVDLAIKDTHGVRITVPASRKVDPRSGHSAVLSEDGSKLVVLGGWVGDISMPAEPQLVILEVGGHGGGVGFEEWRWGIPPPSLDAKKGLWQDGKGVYGHGAVLLPGNVMMVYGGYEISGHGGSKKIKKGKRGAGEVNAKSKRQVSSTGVRFFNITSMEWQGEYTHPSAASSPNSPNGGGSNGNTGNSNDDPEDKSTVSSSSPKFLGLGIGLGVGIPVLLGLLLAGFCFRRRQLRRRADRDDALRGLAQGVPISRHGRHDSDEMMERNDPNAGIGFFPWNASTAQEWYTGGLDPYSAPTATNGRRRSLGYETLRGQGGRSNLYQPPPMPPAPLMTSNLFSGNSGRPRGSVARGLYQPTTGNDGGMGIRSPNSRSNRIHPIYEDDEDDDLEDGADLGNGNGKHPLSPDADDRDDPFLTPTKEGGVGGGVYFPPSSSQQPPKSSGSGSSSSTGSSEMVQVKNQQQQRQAQDPEVQGWVSEVDAADAVLSARISRHGSTTTRPPALKLSGTGSGNGGQTTPTRLSPTRRAGSNRSGRLTPASAKDSQHDDGRTGSNLSDRSAFSFVQGAERAHIRGSHNSHSHSHSSNTGGHQRSQKQAAIDRSESSGSSSANTYSTAKSNFATMQAEGPSLLLGPGNSPSGRHPLEQELHQDDYFLPEAEDYDPTPGSPSKSKPIRRSWFGSLRRVFSGATPSPGGSSRGDSPTRDSLLGGSGDAQGGDSSSRFLLGMGMGPGGVLLRRKQGREAWEEVLPAPGDMSGQGKGGENGDGEWDVEKAVEQRLVQVMFTVPKERLRVVNADLDGDDASSLRHTLTHQSSRHEEREGVAVLVDPERDGYEYPYQESLKGSMVVESVSGSNSSVAEEQTNQQQQQQDEEKAVPHAGKGKEKAVDGESETMSIPVPVPVPGSVPAQEQQQPKPGETKGHKPDLLTVSDHLRPGPETASRRNSSTTATSHKGVSEGAGEGAHSESGVSPSPSMRSIHTIHTAEMVRLERPRTRVLEMVESIESKSRDGSPSGSPVRGS
ncbi:hypothetical protein V8F20_005571 [Naviculisporaceae sp. PSN 640]